MIIHITPDELVEEYRDSWEMEYIKHPSIDYATNAIHGWLNDEEVIIFYFKDYGFINDNKSNTNNNAMSNLKWITIRSRICEMRSDNQVLISGLRKGRSKFEDMNIVIQMIFDALIELQISLATWRVKAWSQAKVLFIGTKENVMSDALSRDDLLTFHNYVDNK